MLDILELSSPKILESNEKQSFSFNLNVKKEQLNGQKNHYSPNHRHPFEISMDEGVNLIDSFFTVIYHKKVETMKRN